jgi:hypothetical protein
VTVRAYGVAFAVLGAIVGVVPFLDWYRLDLPGRDLRVSGVQVAGELWVLPLLGAVAIAIGTAILALGPDPARRVSRWLGGATAITGAFAVLWAAKAVWWHRTTAYPVGVPDAPAVPLSTQPLGYLAVAAAAALAAVALLWLRAGTD